MYQSVKTIYIIHSVQKKFPSLIHQVHFTMIIGATYHVHILTCVSIFKINIWWFTSGGFQHAHVRRQGVPEERLPRSLLLLLQCQTYSGQVSFVAAWWSKRETYFQLSLSTLIIFFVREDLSVKFLGLERQHHLQVWLHTNDNAMLKARKNREWILNMARRGSFWSSLLVSAKLGPRCSTLRAALTPLSK